MSQTPRPLVLYRVLEGLTRWGCPRQGGSDYRSPRLGAQVLISGTWYYATRGPSFSRV